MPAAKHDQGSMAGSRYRIELTKIMCKSVKYTAGSQQQHARPATVAKLPAPQMANTMIGTYEKNTAKRTGQERNCGSLGHTFHIRTNLIAASCSTRPGCSRAQERAAHRAKRDRCQIR